MSARARRTTRRRSLVAESEPPTPSKMPKTMATLPESVEASPELPIDSFSSPAQQNTLPQGPIANIRNFLAMILGAIWYIFVKVVTLPLFPLRHLRNKTYIRRMDSTTKVSEMKRELRALEKELEKAKRRNSIVSAETKVLAVAPVVFAPPPPPPPAPPKLPPPPPPGMKAGAKTWSIKSSDDSNTSNSNTLKAKAKASVPKKGFDISAAQIASIAGRLRRTSENPVITPRSKDISESGDQLSSEKDLGATLRARMKTRRSSLLQSIDNNKLSDSENSDNPPITFVTLKKMTTGESGTAEGTKSTSSYNRTLSPSSKGQKHTSPRFKSHLRRAPIARSPGGTPLRDPTANVTATTPLFNTALADRNCVASPPRDADAPVF